MLPLPIPNPPLILPPLPHPIPQFPAHQNPLPPPPRLTELYIPSTHTAAPPTPLLTPPSSTPSSSHHSPIHSTLYPSSFHFQVFFPNPLYSPFSSSPLLSLVSSVQNYT
ncbi:uncharacterized protein LOC135112507 [Scylla paramamosain]|uniref:uncharacterized protein LOC135112507 n=1 Tax=Scylla paramamosain TaxID=85552 RepID=UPI00308327ED